MKETILFKGSFKGEQTQIELVRELKAIEIMRRGNYTVLSLNGEKVNVEIFLPSEYYRTFIEEVAREFIDERI